MQYATIDHGGGSYPHSVEKQGSVYNSSSMGQSMASGFGLTPKRLQDNIVRANVYTDKKGQFRTPSTRTAPFGQRPMPVSGDHLNNPAILLSRDGRAQDSMKQNQPRAIETAAASYMTGDPASTAYSQPETTAHISEISMNQGSALAARGGHG